MSDKFKNAVDSYELGLIHSGLTTEHAQELIDEFHSVLAVLKRELEDEILMEEDDKLKREWNLAIDKAIQILEQVD